MRVCFIAVCYFIILNLSCKKEYSFEGGLPFVKCVNCSYLPFCDSSVFVYVNTTSNGIDTVTNIPRILGDTIINGNTFTKISAVSFFNQGLLYNCDKWEYKVLFSTASLGLDLDSIKNALLQLIPVPIPPNLIQIPTEFQTTILKENAAVNARWTDTIFSVSLPPLFTFFMGLEYTLKEKNVQRTVFQKSYNNVIHVRAELKTVSTLGNLPLGFTIDYYFARDVGFIEIQVTNNAVMALNSKLFSYKLR